MPDHIHQGLVAGLVHRVMPVDPAVATGTVVVDQVQRQAEKPFDGRVQVQQIIPLYCLVKALHQQLRAIAVGGEAGRAFLAAMEQAIAIGALGMQFGEQGLTVVEGGAQRLIQGGHARGLGCGRAVYQLA